MHLSGSLTARSTKIFRIFDVNNDGTISQLEMEKLVEDMKVLLGVRLHMQLTI